MDLERHSLGLGQRPALILVDLICGFTDPACPLGSNADGVVAANQALLAAARAKGLPVVFTTVEYHADTEAAVFRARVPALNLLTPGSGWTDVDPRLAPQAGERVLRKLWASAFFGTDLAQDLRAKGADSVIVTGLTTSGCVRATAVDALQSDFPTIVPREAVGDRNAEAHTANLFDLHAKYADVWSLAETLAHIEALPS